MGRTITDFIPKSKEQLISKTWRDLAAQRESALAIRGAKLKERLLERVNNLNKLREGDCMIIQNQTGNQPCP